MDAIKLVQLSEVQEDLIIDLMNHELVGKYLPLLSGTFSKACCQAFLEEKKHLWDTHGYGPYGILINEEFAGWGGLQAEHDDADFALVLHPDFWGWGHRVFKKIKEQAFDDMGFNSITALLPPSRLNARAITRLGFAEDGQLLIDNEPFIKYRLTKP